MDGSIKRVCVVSIACVYLLRVNSIAMISSSTTTSRIDGLVCVGVGVSSVDELLKIPLLMLPQLAPLNDLITGLLLGVNWHSVLLVLAMLETSSLDAISS